MPSLKRIHFVSLGCARNLVDTEVMLGLVLEAGYEVVEEERKADFLIVNTCGFLESAREESCLAIDALLNKKKRGAKVVVTGCMVRHHKEELKKRFPEVHFYLGSGDLSSILEALRSAVKGEILSSQQSFLEEEKPLRHLSTPPHFAYLKIAEGCAKRCAFCIIPTIKGPLRSRRQESVLEEFDALLAKGVKEIILIAQDLGDYGKERGEKGALEKLVKQMLKRKGNFWIRFLYLYPDEVTEELVALIASDSRICAYVDMPLQHINDEMLKAMRRKTNRAHILSVLGMLKEKIPHIVIRSSLIVGFPGETEEQFQELVKFVEEYPIDQLGIFKYSAEEGSAAARLPGQLSYEVKQERFDRLALVQKKRIHERNQRYVGQILEVVVEGYHPDSPYLMRGRFYGQCPEMDGQVIINDGRLVTAFGERYFVKITQAIDYDLVGAVLMPASRKKLKVVS